MKTQLELKAIHDRILNELSEALNVIIPNGSNDALNYDVWTVSKNNQYNHVSRTVNNCREEYYLVNQNSCLEKMIEVYCEYDTLYLGDVLVYTDRPSYSTKLGYTEPVIIEIKLLGMNKN